MTYLEAQVGQQVVRRKHLQRPYSQHSSGRLSPSGDRRRLNLGKIAVGANPRTGSWFGPSHFGLASDRRPRRILLVDAGSGTSPRKCCT
jgi:hypothetical protein